MIKKLYYGLITLILVSLIVNFSGKAFGLWRSGGKIEEKRRALAALEKENWELKRQKEEVESPRFIEQEAREKLGLGKAGEVVVVLPPIKTVPKEDLASKNEVQNWKKWWQFFVY